MIHQWNHVKLRKLNANFVAELKETLKISLKAALGRPGGSSFSDFINYMDLHGNKSLSCASENKLFSVAGTWPCEASHPESWAPNLPSCFTIHSMKLWWPFLMQSGICVCASTTTFVTWKNSCMVKHFRSHDFQDDPKSGPKKDPNDPEAKHFSGSWPKDLRCHLHGTNGLHSAGLGDKLHALYEEVWRSGSLALSFCDSSKSPKILWSLQNSAKATSSWKIAKTTSRVINMTFAEKSDDVAVSPQR